MACQIRLGEAAVHMGAVHKLDLTSDVTHLLVGQVDSAKYKHVAKERPDVHVLRPDWVEEVRKSWLAGGDTDVADLEERFRLPTFFGLHICVTGFNDCRSRPRRFTLAHIETSVVQERQDIQDNVNNNGATYHGDLIKSVTHLVAAEPRGAKYDRAKLWGIKIVSHKWFMESLERGMVLEEQAYNPLVAVEEQGRGALPRKQPQHIPVAKRMREAQDTVAAEDARKRKMRRTASTRLSSHSQNLWADLSVSEQVDDSRTEDQWDESQAPSRPDSVAPTSETMPLLEAERPGNPAATSHTVREERGLFAGWTCFAMGHEVKTACLALSDYLISSADFYRHNSFVNTCPKTAPLLHILSKSCAPPLGRIFRYGQH